MIDRMRLGIHFRLAEFGADGQHDIACRQFLAQRRHAEIAGERQRMAGRQDALAVDGHEHRRVEALGERANLAAASAAPPPATISGRLCRASSAAAFSIAAGRGAGPAGSVQAFGLCRPSPPR